MPRLALAPAALALALAGCAANRQAAAPVAPPPVVATMPVPPAGASAGYLLPPRGPDGRWLTPNASLSAAAAVWHLRSGLNVAALGCRDAGEGARVAAYNALLARHAAAFTAANRTLAAEYKAAGGATWRDAEDDAMTRLYNYWAQPPVQRDLCAAADAVLADAALLPADGLGGFAPAALARLEAPFLAFYDRYQGYRTALAAWQAGGVSPAQPAPAQPTPAKPATAQPAPVRLAAAAPVPLLTVDPAVFGDARLAR